MEVDNLPFLQHLLDQLSDQGIKRFVLMTGYLADQIKDYFGDGSKWGWEIQYSTGPKEWETGRRIFEARELIDERFLLLYSDNFINLNLSKLNAHSIKYNLPLTLSLFRKDQGNISMKDGIVEIYDSTRQSDNLNYVEVGYMILKKQQMIDCIQGKDSLDISFSEVIKRFVDENLASGYFQEGKYQSISDPERLEITRKYFSRKNILLLDRDGVINEKMPKGEYVSDWSKFEFIPETLKSLQKLSQKGFEFIIISNQAGIARKMIKKNNLEQITEFMTENLTSKGINILDTFICPHHWDDQCFCRKPSPGNFIAASEKFQFRLDKVIYVGDDVRDCKAAFNAGCKSAYLGEFSELYQLEDYELPLVKGRNFLKVIPDIIDFYSDT
jgi:D-glycero-D-manno-heptose 1,7-bisphosphate phosphatase